MKENKQRFPLDIQKLMSRIKQERFYHPENLIQYCQTLLDYAKAKHEPYLSAYAYFYLGDSMVSQGKVNDTINYLLDGIAIQEHHSYFDLLPVSYNLLGVCHYTQGDLLLGLEYLYKGLNIVEKSNNYIIEGKIYNNIGVIYMEQQDYKNALRFFEKCDKVSKKATNETEIRSNQTTIYLNYAICYLGQGKIDLASEYINKTYEIITDEELADQHIGIETLKVQLAYQRKQLDTCCTLAHEVASLPIAEIERLEFFPQLIEIVTLLIKLNQLEDAKTLLDKITVVLEKEPSHSNYVTLFHTLITYYEATDDSLNRLRCLKLYYDYQKKWQAENQKSIISSIDNRLHLEQETSEYEQLREKNKKLSKLSSSDALTGLWNRYGLKQHYLTHFPLAKSQNIPYGVMIIDIDYFKQYNDANGHLQGDRCICKIASLIQESLPADCYAARYGGDEFFIVSTGKSDEELLALAECLKNKVSSSNLSFSTGTMCRHITLSIGIFNAVPGEEHTVTDFIHAADNTLYAIKQATKNAYQLSNQHLT